MQRVNKRSDNELEANESDLIRAVSGKKSPEMKLYHEERETTALISQENNPDVIKPFETRNK